MGFRARFFVVSALAAVLLPVGGASASAAGDWIHGSGGTGFDGSVVAEPLADGSVLAVTKHGFGPDGSVSVSRLAPDGSEEWSLSIPEDPLGGFYGTEFVTSLELPSGEVLFSGYADPASAPSGKFDAVIIGVTPDGYWRTVARWGGPAAEFARDLALCSDGSLYAGGTVWDGSASPGETEMIGMTDIFVTRFDPDLRRTWTRQLGSRNNDALFSLGCRSDLSVDLNAWAAGVVNGVGSNDHYNFLTARLSSTGVTLRTSASVQDAGEWSPQDGVHSPDGSYYVVGESNGGYFRMSCTEWALGGSFVAKFGADGAMLWWDLLPCANLNRRIVIGRSGDLFVLGEAAGKRVAGQQKFGGTDFLLHRYSPDGERLWTRQFGSSLDEVGSSLAVDGNGGVVIGAYSTGSMGGHEPAGGWDAYVMRTDVSDGPVLSAPTPAAQECTAATSTMLADSGSGRPIWIYGDDIGEARMAALWEYAGTHGPHDFGRVIAADQGWLGGCHHAGIGLGTGSGYSWHDRNVVLWVWTDAVDLEVARRSVMALVDSLLPAAEPVVSPTVAGPAPVPDPVPLPLSVSSAPATAIVSTDHVSPKATLASPMVATAFAEPAPAQKASAPVNVGSTPEVVKSQKVSRSARNATKKTVTRTRRATTLRSAQR